MKKSILLLLICMVGLSGCTVYKKLIITEVGLSQVELYLDEPSNESINYTNYNCVLKYMVSNGDVNEVALPGTLQGGNFVVIWEAPNYTGDPVPATYKNYDNDWVPGIKVSDGFFGAQTGTNNSFAFRITGRRKVGNTTYKIDDVVKFGPYDPAATPPVHRPPIGGTFHQDGSLAGAVRTVGTSYQPAETIRRRFDPVGSQYVPRETSQEADWRLKSESFGLAK